MKVKSQLIDAQLEQTSTDPTKRSQIVYDTDDALIKYGDGSGTKTVVEKDAAQTLTTKTLTSPVLNGSLSGTAILDEDDMTSNASDKVPTQQSVKAYIDNEIASLDSDSENALAAHEIDSSTHGVSGVIVGTVGAQTLQDKTVVVADNTITTAASGNLTSTELNAALAELQADIDTRALDSDFDTHVAATSAHGVSGSVVGTSDTQTLTNKTVGDSITFTELASTPSNPASGRKKLYAKDNGQLYTLSSAGIEQLVGAGAGSGGVNHISNGDAEGRSTDGWSLYKDSGDTPTDGEGGTPTELEFFIAAGGSSSYIRGDAVFELTRPVGGIDAQGEGVAYEFLVDAADCAASKELFISFEYYIETLAGIGYTDGDLKVYVYSELSNALIPVLNDDEGEIRSSATPTKWMGKFSTVATGNVVSAANRRYKLIFHYTNATTTNHSWRMFFDSVRVFPDTPVPGAIITPTQTYTPIVSNLGTGSGTATSYWAQVGDKIELDIYFTKDGSAGTGTSAVTFSLPSGVTLDTSKAATTNVGFAETLSVEAASQFSTTGVDYSGGVLRILNAGNSNTYTGADFRAGSFVHIRAKFPVTGWSASAMLSTTELMMRGTNVTATLTTATNTTTGAFQDITFGTETKDALGEFDGLTYTARVAQKKIFIGKTGFAASATGQRVFRSVSSVSGNDEFQSYIPNGSSSNVTMFIYAKDMVAGETLKFQVYQNTGGNLNYGGGFLHIMGYFDPTVFSVYPDTIDVELYVDTGNGHGSTNTKIRRYTNSRKNTLGNYATYADSATLGASVTINIPGLYRFTRADSNSSAASQLGWSINGSALTTNIFSVSYAQGSRAAISTSSGINAEASFTARLSAGDIVRPHGDGTSNVAGNLAYMQVVRIGP